MEEGSQEPIWVVFRNQILNENVIRNEDGGGREAKSDLRPILNKNVIRNHQTMISKRNVRIL